MTTPAETNASCLREIQVEVPADVVARETDSVIQKFQKHARLPGFRKGKAPASMIRQRFADDIRGEVIEALVPRYFHREAERQKLTPVSQPRVTDLHLHEGEPLRFKASFEVLPEPEITGYDAVKVETPEVTVTDEEVQQALDNLRQQRATFSPIEGRALADGDFAQVSLSGRHKEGEGAGAPPVNMDEVLVEVGGEGTLPEFTENLRGASVGEERTFDVTYPADFSDPRLAGKTLTYTLSIKGIKQKSMPALDDAFAKELGEFATLDEVRHRIREGMEAEKRHHAEHQAKEKLLEQLVERNDFPVPESLVERQIDLRLERGLRALAAQGMRQEDMKKMDFTRLRDGQREAARREVKASLILDRIADKEKVEVTEEEIEKEVQSLAAQSRQPAEALRARLTRDGVLDRIRDRIRSEKTLDVLYRRSA